MIINKHIIKKTIPFRDYFFEIEEIIFFVFTKADEAIFAKNFPIFLETLSQSFKFSSVFISIFLPCKFTILSAIFLSITFSTV